MPLTVVDKNADDSALKNLMEMSLDLTDWDRSDMVLEEPDPDPKKPLASEPPSPRAEDCLEYQERVKLGSHDGVVSSSSSSPRIGLHNFLGSPPTTTKEIAPDSELEELSPMTETSPDLASQLLLTEEFSEKSSEPSDEDFQSTERVPQAFGSSTSLSASPSISSFSRLIHPQHLPEKNLDNGNSPKPLGWSSVSSIGQKEDAEISEPDFDVNSNQPRSNSTQEQVLPPASDSSETEKEIAPKEIPVARPFKLEPSDAAVEWERQKEENPAICEEPWTKEVDRLMALVGLEEVKARFLAIKAKIDTCQEQEHSLKKTDDTDDSIKEIDDTDDNVEEIDDTDDSVEEIDDAAQDFQVSLKSERFNVILQGNPGTGKTTVARLFARFMKLVGALDSDNFKETSGAKLAYKGPRGTKKTIKKLTNDDGGTLFIDEAYQLTAPHTSIQGRQALDIVLTEMEKNVGTLLVILAGYKNDMEAVFEHNPGLASRIPYTLHFADFTDDELWKIMCDKIKAKYGGKMQVEGGLHGLYMHVAIRRLGLGRGSKNFGNARAVENLLGTISERQALRLRKEVRRYRNRPGKYEDPNRFLYTKEDLIGPDPTKVKKESQAWKDLKNLTGLETVKKAVENFFGMIELNYKREMSERHPIRIPLNQVFVGAPGTGKTTVARLYGRILADLGLLSRGEVVLKNPSDFIGDAVGKSEANTRAILASTRGKVLVIDEAYMLHPGENQMDSYRSGVIDTIVAEVQGILGEDRCIILVGYEDRLRNMFYHANPGLSRRFPIENPFRFENFTVPQLEEIIRSKMKDQDLKATNDAYRIARETFERALMRPNFSNSGEVESLMTKAKMSFEARYADVDISKRPFEVEFLPQDIDPNFDRGARCESGCKTLLGGLVSDAVVTKFEQYQRISMTAQKYGLNPRDLIPTNLIFKGPPGTGKTTAALKMGKIFYDIGFLSTDAVVSCTASDFIGQYVGQTAPKTKTQLDKALGKVLVIDEAHQLKEGHYASEAANELIQFLTRTENVGRIVVILVGYAQEINELMAARPGLSGLFTEEVVFENIGSDDCTSLLERKLANHHVQAPFLKDPSSEGYKQTVKSFDMVRTTPSWSNARNVQTLAKRITNLHISNLLYNHEAQIDGIKGAIPHLSLETLLSCLNGDLQTQMARSAAGAADKDRATANTVVPAFDPTADTFRVESAFHDPPPQQVVHTNKNCERLDSTTIFQSAVRVDSLTWDEERQPPSLFDTKQWQIEELADSEEDDKEERLSVHEPSSSGSEGGDEGPSAQSPTREPGVSDATWSQLEATKRTRSQHHHARDDEIARLQEESLAFVNEMTRLGRLSEDEMRKWNEVEDRMKRLRDDKSRETDVQRALGKRGPCVYGYDWYAEGGGWRCYGGSHFVSDHQLMKWLD